MTSAFINSPIVEYWNYGYISHHLPLMFSLQLNVVNSVLSHVTLTCMLIGGALKVTQHWSPGIQIIRCSPPKISTTQGSPMMKQLFKRMRIMAMTTQPLIHMLILLLLIPYHYGVLLESNKFTSETFSQWTELKQKSMSNICETARKVSNLKDFWLNFSCVYSLQEIRILHTLS